jgi:hypothetical protein
MIKEGKQSTGKRLAVTDWLSLCFATAPLSNAPLPAWSSGGFNLGIDYAYAVITHRTAATIKISLS